MEEHEVEGNSTQRCFVMSTKYDSALSAEAYAGLAEEWVNASVGNNSVLIVWDNPEYTP